MKDAGLILITGLLLNGLVSAQPLSEVRPGLIGLTPEGIKSLDSLMERYTQSDRFPCAMLMVTRKGKIGYWKAFGVRDLKTNIKLERNDVFRIYSLTKPVTGVAVMMLWEQGKIGLDDPVEKYIPSFSNLKVLDENGYHSPKHKMTIRHLLNFSSGTTYGLFGSLTKADSVVAAARLFEKSTSLADLIDRLSGLPLTSEPGEAISYGFQTDVLGRIVEIVSGIPLDQFFRKNIFDPLGMNETGVLVSGNELNKFPSLYNRINSDKLVRMERGDSTSRWFRTPSVDLGGSSLVSTPGDYIRFFQMLANKGEYEGKRIIKSSTVELMTKSSQGIDISKLEALQGPGWLPGFQVLVGGDMKVAGGGSEGFFWMSGAANLYAWVDPASGIVGMVWCQAWPYMSHPIFNDTRKMVYKSIKD